MKSKKVFAALLAAALTLGTIPFTSFNASTAMKGENLNPSKCISTPIATYDEKLFKVEEKEMEKALKTGYVKVPEDPTKPIEAITEKEALALKGPKAKANIISNVPYYGKEYFAFLSFKATRGNTNKKPHLTSFKTIDGKLDTSNAVFCLRINKDNPETGTPMQKIREESTNLLYLIRLGSPGRCNTDRVPAEVRNCFYPKSKSNYQWLNYYITQAAVWVQIGDTTEANIKAADPAGDAPADLKDRVIRFRAAAKKYGPDWANPRIWINHERKEATTDQKDPSQLCTPNYELDVGPMDEPRDCLKLMERNVYTDAATDMRKPPAMEMSFPNGKPRGLRVLVYDKREKKTRVYHIDNGDVPKLYGQDQFRFIIPNPTSSGEFKYVIKGSVMTWRAYRYESGGNYQPMLKEEIVTFGEQLQTAGTIFWEKEITPEPPTEIKEYVIRAKKVDAQTGQALPGAKFSLEYPDGALVMRTTGTNGIAEWAGIPETAIGNGRFKVTEATPPPGYTLPPNATQIVTLPPQNGTTVTITFRDEKETQDSFELKAIKKDAADKRALQGATFELTKPDNTKVRGTSNNEGIVVFSNLTATGRYVIEEIQAPQGYELAANPRQEVNVTDPKNPPTTMFEFLNQKSQTPKHEIKATKVDKGTKAPLQGAVFELTGPGNYRQEITTGADGLIHFTNLDPGTYTLTEKTPPQGYQLAANPTQQITVPGNNATGLIFENEKKPDKPTPKPEKHSISATKVDKADKKPLQGAVFELTGANGFKQEATTSADGTVKFDGLDAGKYTLTEKTPPQGYQLAANPSQEVTVPGNTQGLIFENEKIPDKPIPKPEKGRVELLKYDSTDNKHLPGVEFELFKKDGTSIGKYTTGEDGRILVDNLDPGEYYFMETKALEGYYNDKEKLEFTIPGEGGLIQLTKGNRPDNASVEITKTDVSTGEVLSGATLKIYAEDKTTVLAEGVTDSSGKFSFGPLKPGKYYFQESGAPEGYVLDDTLFPFEIKPGGEIVKCTMTNRPEEGKVEITKTDVSTGEVIEGAHLKIYAEDKTTVIAGGVTDKNGKFMSGSLKPGKYYFQETGAPLGYVLDDTLYPFEIKPGGEIVKCTMTNKPIKGTLEITKTDISDGKLLPNAHFIIYDEDKNQVVKGVTDDKGIAKFQLDYGKYYYQEYDAPVGYQVDDTLFPFEIKTDGEIVKCRMTNVPKPVPMLPTTGSTIATGGGLIAAVGVIASAVFKRWL